MTDEQVVQVVKGYQERLSREGYEPHAIDFNRMTCAQCHQVAARDGVHMALNDGLDRRISAPVRASEYLYREIDRQLGSGPEYWRQAPDG